MSFSTPSKNKFLGKGGVRLVRQLFIENDSIGENDVAIYTMHREGRMIEGKVYPSLYVLYMQEKDITEARFVSKYLYDWQQWNSIAASSWYRDEIARWRTDLKAKLMGELVDKLIEDAHSDSRSSKSSAKYLVDKLSKGPKGKPSTAVVPTNEETAQKITHDIAEDVKRLRLIN